MTRLRRETRLTVNATLALVLASCTATDPSPTATPASIEPTASASASASAVETSEPSASEPAGETVRVSMEGSRFDPEELTITAGTEVVFVNESTFGHTVTEGTGGRAVEDPIIDEEVAEGASAPFTFDEPGTYEITCRIHPTMQLTVTVEG